MLKFSIHIFISVSLIIFTAHCGKKNKLTNFCMIGSEEFNAIADSWNDSYTEKNMIHEGRGNGTAVKVLSEDICSMAALSRPLSDREVDAIVKKTGKIPAAIPVAEEALAVIADKQFKPDHLTQKEITEIFTGPKTDSSAKIFGVNSASDRFRFFRDTALMGNQVSDRIIELSGPLALVDRIAKEKNALGYARPAELTADVKIIGISVKNQVVFPDANSVQSGKYPFSRYYYIYVRTDRLLDSDTAKFLNHIISTEGQKMLIPHGLFPLSESDRMKSRLEIQKLTGKASVQK